MQIPTDHVYESFPGLTASKNDSLVSTVSSIFSNSFGINPKTNKPYKLGKGKTRTRLETTDHLFLAKNFGGIHIGYLYGRELPYLENSIGWIDSLAVLPEFQRMGIGTQLVTNFVSHFSKARWLGCVTPNPVTALVVSKVLQGRIYVGECNPPEEIITMIESVRASCPDLTGVEFNEESLLVRTEFTSKRSGDSRKWSPPKPTEPPPWWSSLEKLPSQYEALLIAEI